MSKNVIAEKGALKNFNAIIYFGDKQNYDLVNLNTRVFVLNFLQHLRKMTVKKLRSMNTR